MIERDVYSSSLVSELAIVFICKDCARKFNFFSEQLSWMAARPLHLGRSTQIWEIRIEDEQQRLVCISRLTLAVVPRNAI